MDKIVMRDGVKHEDYLLKECDSQLLHEHKNTKHWKYFVGLYQHKFAAFLGKSKIL